MRKKTAYIKKVTQEFITELDGNHRKLPYIVPYYLSKAYEEGRSSILDKLAEITNEPIPVAVNKINKEIKNKKTSKRP